MNFLTCRALPAVLVFVGISLACAQDARKDPFKDLKTPGAPAPGGMVTGRVLFADTGGPARFTKVLLKSVAPPDGKDDFMFAMTAAEAPAKPGSAAAKKPKLSVEDQAEQASAKAASAKFLSALTDLMISATVGADGVYTFTNVKAGTYYVHAMAPGYIDPLAQFTADDLSSTDPAMKQKVAAVATLVTVSGTDSGRADLRLERGASIAGRLLYDDGTPAAGWVVRTMHPASGTAAAAGAVSLMPGVDMADLDLSHLSQMSTTDDTGHFRIAGLATGDYILQARLTAAVLAHSAFNAVATNAGSPMGGMGGMAAMTGLKLTVYSGNVTGKAEAKAVSVRAGDDRAGYDMTVPLHAMHTISGMVRAKNDAHPVNGGTVELTAQDSEGKDDPSFHLTAAIGGDGRFVFDYVPGPGRYTLKASHAVDATTVSTMKMMGSTIAEQKTNRSYGPASVVTTLGDGDVSDVKIDVPDGAGEAGTN